MRVTTTKSKRGTGVRGNRIAKDSTSYRRDHQLPIGSPHLRDIAVLDRDLTVAKGLDLGIGEFIGSPLPRPPTKHREKTVGEQRILLVLNDGGR